MLRSPMTYRHARFVCLFLLFSISISATLANASPVNIKLEKQGIFTLEQAQFQLGHYGKNWGHYTTQQHLKPTAGFPKQTDQTWHLNGTLDASGLWQIDQKINWQSDTQFDYHIKLNSDKPITTESLALEISLPIEQYAGGILYLDGKPWQLPAKMKKMSLLRQKQVKQLTLHGPKQRVVITGKMDLYIQDNRQFKSNTFVIRIALNPSKGKITEAFTDLSIAIQDYNTKPVSLRDAANTSFKDEKSNDRKGGWTDQGDNDMRVLPTGLQKLGGIPFELLDDTQTHGQSCIVLAGPDRDYLPSRAVIQSVNRQVQSLHLLHALAWTPRREMIIGNIHVTYQDGDTQNIPVTCGIDLDDWWLPASVPNGMVAWSGENAQNKIGLYRSSFSVRKKPIESIQFKSNGKAVWMIAAVAAGDDVPIPKQNKFTLTANQNWAPFNHQIQVKTGSVLDLSFMQDAPAGKHGRVITRKNQMVFEQQPDKPVRFYGSNICFSTNYLSKDHVNKLVKQMLAMGYNTVRLHHYDRDLVNKKSTDSVTLNAAQLDRLDYLFAQLKKAGIYIAIDLYTIRSTKNGEIKNLNRTVALQEYKVMAAIHDGVLENWKTFARNLLTHINPYTGLRWMDDPALLNICLLNEDNLYAYWQMARSDYEAAFDHYLKFKQIKPRNDQHRDEFMQRFLWQAQLDLYKRCAQFVKKELGVKTLISDLNMHDHIALGLIRDRMDYVENHAYWDHPRYFHATNRLPLSLSNRSSISEHAAVPRDLMTSRIMGKPFGVTEYNFCPPNHYRAESGPLMGAYAALQDWQMIHRFAYSHWAPNTLAPKHTTTFDIVTDPISLLSDRIAALLFRRGDVKAAPGFIPYVASDNWLDTPGFFDWKQGRMPLAYAKLGLLTRIGMIRIDEQQSNPTVLRHVPIAISQQTFPPSAVGQTKVIKADKNMIDQLINTGQLEQSSKQITQGIYTSQTGQIKLNANAGQMTVTTPRSVCVVMSDQGTVTAGDVTVKNQGHFGTVFVSSLDEQTITQTERLLVMHLTDVANSGLTFANRLHTKLVDWGKQPHLIRKGKMLLTIQRNNPKQDRVWRVNMAGERLAEVPVKILTNAIAFEINTHHADGNTMVYEIQRDR